MKVNGPLITYIESESIKYLDKGTLNTLKEALADIIACTIAGRNTNAAEIAKEFAVSQWGTGNSSLFLFPDKLTTAGASFVNATMANALDLDDGHRLTKGHPGAVIFPAVLAVAEENNISGAEFLTALLIGYEVGIRAGIAVHLVRPDYHCTGSWGAVGAAAGVSYILGLMGETIEHALGNAEYFGTYSPMMRCIEHPSMLKDGINWGCMAGVSAAHLAKAGYTGIPSLFTTEEAEELTDDLGTSYRVNELYYKPHACCRWAQPAIEAIRGIQTKHPLVSSNVKKIVIHTFTESAALSKEYPETTEEAQYNLFFPVAAYLAYGEVGPKQVLDHLDDPIILGMMDKVSVVIDQQLNEAFPEKALSMVKIVMQDGSTYQSDIIQARGDYDYPLLAEEKKEKFFWLTTPILGQETAKRLLESIQNIEHMKSIRELMQV
ncbi:MmgE/PrpD family protein [Peribacillus cavernae]|uniref:MmgE/PrpD family protein n=1 Tax=Peribacillus cavernae TaxID=1674310 RepID=A0A3S0U1A8_9BACI|nr:MmgE/PrpD family protein [Peribacillus cavernae]MDQ0217676.1 2-methylcitrate dehydratase PrpD [Peribacillus cavernae]RUQ28149.1 MmgE/PrpD family protein [Peribacillus cavernae]